jgi:hypothetical protein
MTLDLDQAIRLFASDYFSECSEDTDISAAFDHYLEAYQISDHDGELIASGIMEAAEEAGAVPQDDDSVASFLSYLAKPFPKPSKTTPNNDDDPMHPLPGEAGVKRFLQQLRVAKHPDPYGNKGFDGGQYQTFNRTKNNFGHSNVDFNGQSPSRPLSNPILNVQNIKNNFECVDSVGIGKHFRVVNHLTNEYCSPTLHSKSQGDQIAADLNQQFLSLLGENDIIVTDEPQQATLPIPVTHLQENLLVRDDNRMNRYLSVLNRPNFTSQGSIAQSGPVNTAIADLKAQHCW